MITVKVSIEMDQNDETPSEALAVQMLQSSLSIAANMSPEQMVQMWREALAEFRRGARTKHAHRSRRKGASA